MSEMPKELYDLCAMYDDHIGFSANEGYPLAVGIRNAFNMWRKSGEQAALNVLEQDIHQYHQLYEAGPMCGCGANDEHIMPGYRVCHPCAETRQMYPDVFGDDEEDATWTSRRSTAS